MESFQKSLLLRFSKCCAGIALLINCMVFAMGWSQPLLAQHSFRQTQTAITVYWGLVDGWHFAYKTPIFGWPWAVPFEFPTFQWIVSAVYRFTGLPLDTAGRLTSFGFHLACAGVLGVLLRLLGVARWASFAGIALFLLAPVDLFWGRSFMIESCALFLALCFIVTVLVADKASTRPQRFLILALATALGALAAATKITTFVVPAAVAVGLVIPVPNDDRGIWRRLAEILSRCAPTVIATAVALAIAITWYHFTDAEKALNPFAATMTSSRLTTWNFGTLADRFSSELWLRTLLGRALPESVTLFGAFAILVLGGAVVRGRQLWILFVFVCAYLGVFLIFPNLNMIHDYYQYGNAVFITTALAVALGAASSSERPSYLPLLCGLVAVAVLTLQVASFSARYLPSVIEKFSTNDSKTLALAQDIREITAEDEVTIAFGLGTWSSEIPYYAQRRMILTLPAAGSPEIFLAEKDQLARPYKAAAVLTCGDKLWSELGLKNVTQAASIREVGDCRVARFRADSKDQRTVAANATE